MSFQQVTVYLAFQVEVTDYKFGYTKVVSQHPTEGAANQAVAELERAEAYKLQPYLDQYKVSDRAELYGLYKQLINDDQLDQAEAVWSYFENNSELSYKVVRVFVEDPEVITTKFLWFD
jgi:hypothetical protein